MPPTRGRRTTVRRAAASTSAAKPSIRLTVKAPPSKLRQALNSSDGDTPEPPVRNARSTRNPRIVIEPDTDEDTEEPEEPEEEVEGEDAAGDEDDEEGVEEDEDDAGGDEEEDEEEEDEEEDEEDDDDDEEDDEGDISMAGHPPPPIIKTTGKAQQSGRGRAKIGITVSAPTGGALKSVEDKELEMDDDDLSDLGSEDPLGEDDEGEEDDDLSDTDMEGGSGSATPNLDKLTRRQRAAYQQQLEGGLMALSNEATKKKELTAEEHAMRRAEMARRRKNLSEKRNEEEKVCYRILHLSTNIALTCYRWTQSISCSRSQHRSAAVALRSSLPPTPPVPLTWTRTTSTPPTRCIRAG